MSAQEELQKIVEKVNREPGEVQGMNVIYQFELSDQETHQVRLHHDQATYTEGSPEKADCTLICSQENFIKLVEGKLNPTTAMMTGKLKIKGNLSLAVKLQSILKAYQ